MNTFHLNRTNYVNIVKKQVAIGNILNKARYGKIRCGRLELPAKVGLWKTMHVCCLM